MSPRDEYIPRWAIQPSKQGEKFLQATRDDGTVTVVPLDAQPAYLLGRNGQVCDVAVDHKSASRVHACLAHHKEGILYLVDLGSVHGTAVDGVKVEPNTQRALLADGATFTIAACPTLYQVVSRETALNVAPGVLEPAAQPEKARHRHTSKHRDHSRRSAESAGVDADRPSYKQSGEGDTVAEANTSPRETNGAVASFRSLSLDKHRPLDRDKDDSDRARSSAQPGRDHQRSQSRQPYADARHSRAADYSHRGPPDRAGHQGRGGGRAGYHNRDRGSQQRPGPPARDGGWNGSDSRGPANQWHGRDDARGPPGPARHQQPAPYRDERRGDHRDDRRQDGRDARPSGRSGLDDPRRGPEKRHSPVVDGDPRDVEGKRRKTGFDSGPPATPAMGGPAASALAPADIVRQMMAAPGSVGPTGAMTVEQKKKLLWAKKKEEVAQVAATPYGANRWNAAEFASEQDKHKFEKLMGVRKAALPAPAPAPPADPMHEQRDPQDTFHVAMTREKQEQVLGELEHHFVAGLRRADGRTVGLGL